MIDIILDFYYTMTILQEKDNDLGKNIKITKGKLNLNNIKIND